MDRADHLLRGLTRWALVALLGTSTCAGHHPPGSSGDDGAHHSLTGIASWYGPGFAGRSTASGEIYDPDDMTCAHRTLPFGTKLLVRNLDNGRTVWLRVNDRGPYVPGRIIDLSYAGARTIDMIGPGTARVELRLAGDLERPSAPAPTAAEPTAWYVQVGAFGALDNAERLAADLTARGFAAVVHRDGELHRVRLGPYPERIEADRQADRLRLEQLSVFVICEPC